MLVHCMGGKDRTGLVSAMLLRLVGRADPRHRRRLRPERGVPQPLVEQWVDDAGDDSERELRRRLSASPAEAMTQVLETLEREHGSVRGYLRAAGVSEADLERVRARLR